MKAFRILHVDDDLLTRNAVELTLGSNSSFALMGCASGDKALIIAAEFAPDLMLCDVMMAGLNKATEFASLRASTRNEKIPTIFFARDGQSFDLNRLRSLGAATLIIMPFESAKLIGTVRDMLRSAKLAAVNFDFDRRLRNDAASLAIFRRQLSGCRDAPVVPEGLLSCAHKLAGAAGVFNFPLVSAAAAALEDAIREGRAGLEAELDTLLECIEGA